MSTIPCSSWVTVDSATATLLNWGLSVLAMEREVRGSWAVRLMEMTSFSSFHASLRVSHIDSLMSASLAA